MLFVLLKVYLDDTEQRTIEVPVTPSSTFADVLDCVREPGNDKCHLTELWNGCERPVSGDEKPVDLLNQWGEHQDDVKFHLKNLPQTAFVHTCAPHSHGIDGRIKNRRRPSKDNDPVAKQNELPAGVDMTLSELQDMAARQQQQIESQQQTLLAKEQRLKFLKEQEKKHQHITSENERLRKLREKVESQELKLKKLRALRGQVSQNKESNGTLNAELESIKSLFNEKEKELAMAVGKVDELTKQLEEIRKGRMNGFNGDLSNSASAIELEKLKKELVARNKMNEKQNAKMIAQKHVLQERKEEMTKMDSRILELQQRLKKRKQQQADARRKAISLNNNNNVKALNRANVAAVEPYIQHTNKNIIENGLDEPPLKNVDKKFQNNIDEGYSEEKLKENLRRISSVFKPTTNERSEDVKIPHVVSVKPGNQNFDKRSKTDDDLNKPPPPCVPSTGSVPVKMPTYSVNRNTGNIAHFAPRPFGSTYGTSNIDKNFNGSMQHPTINIEERQAGSGQSSPASSESSHSSFTQKQHEFLNQNDDKTSGIKSWSSVSAPPVPSRLTHNGKGPPQYVTSTPVSTNSSSVAFSHPVTKPVPHTTFSGTNSVTVQSNLPPEPKLNTTSAQGQIPSSNHLSQNNRLPSTESSVGQKPSAPKVSLNQKPVPRYASKSVIENTYMRRLANQGYPNNIGGLYRNITKSNSFDSSGNIVQNDKISEDSSQRSSDSENSADSNTPPIKQILPPHPHHFLQPASPHYPDIASDKGSYNPHKPKQIRRRHSDSENEELARILNLDKNKENSNGKYVVTDPNLFESQVTSFSNPEPEKVLIDSMGNIVEIQDSSSESEMKSSASQDDLDKLAPSVIVEDSPTEDDTPRKKSNLKTEKSVRNRNRVSFDPLALLLDASLEGELEIVKRTSTQVVDVSASNDEGITALHNAICAGHLEIVKYLVEFGCDVNAPDSDGWTPLHCAASCNNLHMVTFLVEHGACIFATTISDQETAAEKCEEDEDGYDGCFEYLYSIQQKLGIMNKGIVYAVFDYNAQNSDEVSLSINKEIMVLRKGDEEEKDWWWSEAENTQGYVPRNLLGLYPRVLRNEEEE